MPVPIFVPILLIAAGLAIFFYGFSRMKRVRMMADTPTSKVRSIAIGLVEVNGNAYSKRYIKAPFSNDDCVYYRYEIKEYRRHTHTDSKGRTHTTYSWDLISSGEKRHPFYIKDETGKVRIRPDGAEISIPLKKVFLQRAGLFTGITRLIGLLRNIDQDRDGILDIDELNLEALDPKSHFTWGNRVGDRKYFEYYIAPDELLYVLGTAAVDKDTEEKIAILKGENEKLFMISDKSEKELTSSLRLQMIASFIIGGILFSIGLAIIVS